MRQSFRHLIRSAALVLVWVPLGTAAQNSTGVIFDGASPEGWQWQAFYGGDAERHAQLGPDALQVAIPGGAGWALVGLISDAPLMRMPADEQAQVLGIRADFDATDTLLVAMADAKQAGGEPWNDYDLHLTAWRDADGRGQYRLARRQTSTVQTSGVWPEGTQALTLSLRPDADLVLRTASGVELLRASVPPALRDKAWHLRVYTRPARKNAAATLQLRGLELGASAPVALPDADLFFDGAEQQRVLFDGRALAPVWAPYEYYEGYFERHAVVNGALEIDRAAGTDRVAVGIYSPQPVIWLDDVHAGAEARIRLELDGARASGVRLKLTHRLGFDPASRYGWHASWAQEAAQDTVTFSASSGFWTVGQQVPGLDRIPDRIELVINSEGIAVEADGIEPVPLPMPAVRSGAGLRLYVTALPRPDSDETHLEVTRISTTQTPGAASTDDAGPSAAGLAPLPRRVLLEGAPGSDWLRLAPGGLDFEALSQDGGRTLSRGEKPTNSNRIALVSAEPVVTTDDRLTRTAYELLLRLDPALPELGGEIVLAGSADPVDAARHRVGLRILTDGPQAGRLEASLATDSFSYSHWRRVLPPGWHRDHWDGSVRLQLGDGWIAVALGARDGTRVTLSAPSAASKPGSALHLGLLPGRQHSYDRGTIRIVGIDGGWIAPPGMDAVTRALLLDDADFDPNRFLSDFAAEMEALSQ